MAKSTKASGQVRSSNRDGGKQRSPTSTSHRGSRVEPSHITEQQRGARKKKATRAKKAG